MMDENKKEVVKLVQAVRDATTEPVQNYGKGLNEVSERHRRRKVNWELQLT